MGVLDTSNWYKTEGLLHPLAVGGSTLLCVYAWMRLTSARSLNPTSIFSWLVSVALGSTVSRIITQPDLNFTRGILSIFILLFAEWVTTYTASNVSKPFAFLFKSPPILLVFRGKADFKAMRRHRVAPSGLMQACRSAGKIRLAQIEAVIMEANGSFSVIPLLSDEERKDGMEALENVPGYAERCMVELGEKRETTAEPELIALGLNQGRRPKPASPYDGDGETV